MTKMRYAIGLTLPALAACTAIVDGNPAPTETLSSATASAGTGAGGSGSGSTSVSVSVAGGGSGGGAGSTPVTPVTPVDPSSNGLPCDVTALLQHYCVGCHSSPPSGGAPEALAGYANLVAAAKTDATKKVGVLAVSMMQSGVMPPKPAAAPTASEQATFQAWISAGMPQTACTTAVDAVDAGVVATNPYDTPLTCTSNKNWTGGNNGSASMHPGVPCISCHARTGGEAPRYSIAGTIYPSAHEPDNCNGSSSSGSGNLSVLITEANGTTHTLPVNSVGNFYYQGSITTPYHAQVQAGSAVRVMTHTQTSGDCNGCHTVNGASTVQGAASAPGRIMRP